MSDEKKKGIVISKKSVKNFSDLVTAFDKHLKEKRMSEISEILKAAKKRKPDAYSIIGAVSGLGEKRVKEIAEGSEASVIEEKTLEMLS